MAFPIRPSGANRLMRIGWSAARIAHSWRNEGRRATAAPRWQSARPDHFLEQHVGTEVTIGGALTAPGHRLARVLLEEGVGLFLPLDVFGGRGHVIEHGDQVEIGFVRAL